MSLAAKDSIYSICHSDDAKLNFEQFQTSQNDLMNNDWSKKSFQHHSLSLLSLSDYLIKINVPPPSYIPSFIINLPIVKHHKQQDLQRTLLKNNNGGKLEYTMIEIEEKVINELLERSKDSCASSHIDLTDEKGCSCWSKLDSIACWGTIIIVGLIVGGIMILEKFSNGNR